MTSHRAASPAVARGAAFAVFVLTMMNLLNYVDRFVPSVVKDLFKRDLKLSDVQTSLPLTSFIIVYMLASPVFGSLADRWPRKVLIAAGVALWSLATGAAALAIGFWTFLLARAMVGIGEAAYATLSPALISDFFAPKRRNLALTIFYVAIPVGTALGFALGGLLGQKFGWRAAFLICGLPGIAMATLALLIRDPGRGAFDADAAVTPPRWPAAVRALLANRPYILTVAGYAAVTFASGALADWFPAFLQRYRGMSIQDSGSYVGLSVVVGGLGGTLAGGFLADLLKRWTRRPYMALSGWSMALATVCGIAALQLTDPTAIIVMLFLAQFFMWCYNGPVNTTIANSVSSALRARAFAFSILMIHLLGDAVSPSIVGAASDFLNGHPSNGRGLAIAIQLVPLAMGLGAVIWLFAWRMLPEESPATPAR